MEIAADPELRLAIFTAELDSRSMEALNLLAGWAATSNPRPGGHQTTGRARRP